MTSNSLKSCDYAPDNISTGSPSCLKSDRLTLNCRQVELMGIPRLRHVSTDLSPRRGVSSPSFQLLPLEVPLIRRTADVESASSSRIDPWDLLPQPALVDEVLEDRFR